MGVQLGGGGGKKSGSTPNINITPLVDVVLVVLIIFMIVTPMVTKTFWLNLPPVLYFDAASDASYAAAIEAMDLSRTAGVKSIAILTESVMPK
ncbi:MAG: tolR4 [Polyangiaceae bacterium]|nr:tolR4 [Polyangiaceae bacterium]